MRVGDELEAKIEKIVPGGWGLAHVPDGTLLVTLAAPDDVALVKVERATSRVSFASVAQIIDPSPVRVAARCPFFGTCGGCDFQQLRYDAQLAAKVEIVRDCLRRIAHIEADELQIVASPVEWRYRTRAEWQVDREDRQVGYFKCGSHSVVEIGECPVLVPPLEEALLALRAAIKESAKAPAIRSVSVAAGDDGSISFAPRAVGQLLPRYGQQPREISRTIAGNQYRFDAECFFQVNAHILDLLIEEAVGEARGRTALDLYCGVGLFTLPLAKRFERVIAVEENRAACRYLSRNAEEAGAKNVEVRRSSVLAWLRSGPMIGPVDFALLDPPRVGLESETIKRMLSLAASHLVYVGCDPATMARDVRKFILGGYRLHRVRLFDMFPQTHHVETVVHLVR
ncbi:class I SAM-dependent RNA methyltransferase [Pyrinomonas methylaliphatogenes]|uniref:SAM-dependent methyltransferase, tRNA(Uracil-5)-methyltransferase n=1 Tax=Pyrinomonas methylaliphatogenes TaxID=454194 RepID=A0A0B6WW56_9BACT|nr:class I SAM-dependent RNA methyltransferase [Pyrinomonas methylaliphatogenes]CDM65326.1 SAM-dependent methyltransferase, tRNA(uracil-5)-methyltransferase [Pyrinomonas methylaliphatogenes]